jgi:hypothetical protein
MEYAVEGLKVGFPLGDVGCVISLDAGVEVGGVGPGREDLTV